MNSKNDDIKEHILKLANENRLSHALLFCGDDKVCAEFASFTSKAIVCENKKACDICSACKKANSNNHPDIKELVGSKGRQSLHVDDIRALKEECFIVPSESEFNIYIIKDAQNLTQQASNALLKLLEEPPAFVKFILTSPDFRYLLPTITSRCTCFLLKSDTTLLCENTANKYAEILLTAINEDFPTFMLKIAQLIKEKERQIIVDTVDIINDKLDRAIYLKTKENTMFAQDLSAAISSKFYYKDLVSLQFIFSEFKNEILMNGNKNILLTKLCVAVEKILKNNKLNGGIS